MNTNESSDFFLDFSLCKSIGSNKTDSNGNYIFEVEASNENVDLQNQIVLQNALMESKDNFLKKGVISWDHQHKTRDENGNTHSNPEMIIGEPIDVWTNGKSTFVRGILYKSNEIAKDLIQKLKDGSTRIRASVGGIFPKIKKMANGVEQITSVLWNDLALTTSPVNNSVENAVFAKSLNATEFVEMYKSLNAGNGTNKEYFSSGRVLIPEDTEKAVIEVTPTINVYDPLLKKELIKDELIKKLASGTLTTFDDVIVFLQNNFDLNEIQSLAVANEIIKNGGAYMSMHKGKFAQTVDQILKSFKKADTELTDDDFEKSEDETFFDDDIEKSDVEDDDEEIELDTEDETDDDDEKEIDDSDDEEIEKSKKCKKSLDNEDFLDATDLFKSLKDELSELNESINEMKKSLAETVARNNELEEKIQSMSNEPIPMQSIVSKSINSMEQQNSKMPSDKKPTLEDFYNARDVLCKSVKSGELDIMKSTVFEHEIQIAMNGGRMSDECYQFISSHM